MSEDIVSDVCTMIYDVFDVYDVYYDDAGVVLYSIART